MTKLKIIPSPSLQTPEVIEDLNIIVENFISEYQPLESERIHLLQDARTNAVYIECHIRAGSLLTGSTLDVPIDPDEQPEYRANREVVEDHVAFAKMKTDALAGRTFSNLVAEHTDSYDSEHPLKIIGGQHRYIAIKEAYAEGVDEFHGVKVYFGLDSEMRLDVQLISNTNIAASNDLLDRMYETLTGPALRDWCQEVGLLLDEEDFADKRARGLPITVRAARTFILNYFLGIDVDPKKFDETETTPIMAKTGGVVQEWDDIKSEQPSLWTDEGLKRAAKEFALLVETQRDYFKGREGNRRSNVDFSEKAMNYAVLSGWAFTAGILHSNETRLKRHFSIRSKARWDPLNAAVLARGRHKTDPENYRGLGYRTDAKERGRFVELFFKQAEKGEGIKRPLVDFAIKKFHAKQAILEVIKAEAKVDS